MSESRARWRKHYQHALHALYRGEAAIPRALVTRLVTVRAHVAALLKKLDVPDRDRCAGSTSAELPAVVGSTFPDVYRRGWHDRAMTTARQGKDSAPAQEILRQERVRILEFLAHRGVDNVRVFGSVARGEATSRSDIDLLVEFPHAGSVGGELLTVLGLSKELSELLGIRVHVVTPRTLRVPGRELALAEAVPL